MRDDEAKLEHNKAAVRRFNEAVIERGDETAFHALVRPDLVNRSAPAGSPAGPDGMLYFFQQILRPALSDLRVEIHDQIAQGDKVTTRKTIHGTHRGALFGIPATGRAVAIEVIDIVRLVEGRYAEHWGATNLESVVAGLARAA
ncbi:MAG: ester cyclase [Deltaproteobacteria bacterium]|nr:ester cyclase [Deltaproteobacteria bacterium]